MLISTGLYFKLHGRHRPLDMKKGEIKRRKRVIPASHAPNPGALQQQRFSGPDALTLPPPTSNIDIAHRRLPPPPVDFTNYRSSSPNSLSSSRKRTHSEANGSPIGSSQTNGHTLAPIERRPSPATASAAEAALEKVAAHNSASQVDPSLAALDPSLRNNAGVDDKERSREALQRERERIRAQLQALDAELARMDTDS